MGVTGQTWDEIATVVSMRVRAERTAAVMKTRQEGIE